VDILLLKQHDTVPVAAGDGLTWRALLSSPEPDCVKDRVYGYIYPENLPLRMNHVPPDVGTVAPYVEPYAGGTQLKGILRLPPAGTSVASDAARAWLESSEKSGEKVGVSIGFLGQGVKNEFGGLDFTEVYLTEASLVPAGCCESCRVTGRKCRSAVPVTYLLPPTVTLPAPQEKVYSVSPELLGKVMRDAVRQAVAERVAYAQGRTTYQFEGRTFEVGA
jgi:hypothetical protein